MSSEPALIRRKQKNLTLLKSLNLSLLVLIPLQINYFTRVGAKPWVITLTVAAIGALLLTLYRLQQKYRHDIERACCDLGPGVKLVRKYQKEGEGGGRYQIFQEGHRYYYLQHTKTGEKRLVAKEKILQDFDIAL